MQKLINAAIIFYVTAMATLLATAALFGMIWVWAKAFGLMLSVFGVTA